MKLDSKLFVRGALKRIEGIQIPDEPPKKTGKFVLTSDQNQREGKTNAIKANQRVPQNDQFVYFAS
jgi:hypothetical protein